MHNSGQDISNYMLDSYYRWWVSRLVRRVRALGGEFCKDFECQEGFSTEMTSSIRCSIW